MTTEEKQLLLKDLSARLPYEVILLSPNKKITYQTDGNTAAEVLVEEGWKLYLRPMSSMTEEEFFNYKHLDLLDYSNDGFEMPNFRSIDWLLFHHFDFRGLIEKGLALEAPTDIYKV